MAIKTKATKIAIITNKTLKGIALGLAITGAMTAPANARSSVTVRLSNALPISIAMSESGRTTAPFGHVVLCMRNPSQCQARSGNMGYRSASANLQHASFSSSLWSVDHIQWEGSKTKPAYAPIALTSTTWTQLTSVNKHVNTAITPRADGANAAVDFWSTSGRYGDCEDYVIRKRQALIHLGWPSHSVLITLADHPRFGPHAVLIARTGNGDFVLDNLRNNVKPWDQLDYKWEKRQSLQDPKKWVSLNSRVSQSTRIASSSPARPFAQVTFSVPIPTSKPKLETLVNEARIDRSFTTGSIEPAPAISYILNHSYSALKTVEFTEDLAFGIESDDDKFLPINPLPTRFFLD